MADSKISELNALTGSNVATDDVLVIVDTSATETKKILSSELKSYVSTSPTFTTPKSTTTIGVGNATPAASGVGISFPSAASDSSDVNTLDDYEEGTWTPTYAPTGGSFTSVSYAFNAGTYVKIGSIVVVNAYMRTSSANTTGASGTIRITGLPFAPLGSGTSVAGVLGSSSAFVTNNPITLNGTINQVYADLLYRNPSNSAATALPVSDFATGASSNNISFSLMYRTS